MNIKNINRYNKKIKEISFASSLLFTSIVGNSGCSSGSNKQNVFSSNIFSYENVDEAKGLHVDLKGENESEEKWSAEDVKTSHFDLYKKLFTDEKILRNYDNGKPRSVDLITARIKNSVEELFGKGHPHGMLTVLDNKNLPFMNVVAGIGDRPGASELAYLMLDNYWGKGYGKSVVSKIIEEWAPEVAQIGHGQGIDPRHGAIIQSFCCFTGKPLEQIDATSKPSNAASIKILEKTGFKAAETDLTSKEVAIDYQEKNLSNEEEVEKDLQSRFDGTSAHFDPQLEKDSRYQIVDSNGKTRTFSYKKDINQIRYHFEYKLPIVAPK